MELWMLCTLVVIYLVIMAFVVGHKDGSARAIGLVAPVVAICALSWYPDAGLNWAGLVATGIALVLFLIGLNRPNDRDDVWHYLALAVALLGEFVVWLLVVIGNQSVTVPLFAIIIAIMVIAAAVLLFRRNRRATPPTAATQN